MPAFNPVAALLKDKRSPATQRAYASDLWHFFGGEVDARTVLEFVGQDVPALSLRLSGYKGEMLGRGLAEATVNRRLAAVRSLLKICYRAGYSKTDGRGLVDSETVIAYRDTRGVDLETLRALIAAPGTDTLKGKRDTAILRLLSENALRCAEVCSLSLEHFSPREKRLRILGKGRGTQREWVTISDKTVAAIDLYLAAAGHGTAPDRPLFGSLDRRADYKGKRITEDGMYAIIVEHGKKAGLKLSPHKFRHSSLTGALELTDGNNRQVQRLSRHKKIETVQTYDDNRTDMQGKLTRMLSKHL